MAIDVHAHFVPPAAIDTLAERGQDFGIDLIETEPGCHCCKFSSGIQIRPFFETLTNVDIRLKDMDRMGLERQILTLWTDIFGYEMPADKGRSWHRLLNDTLAQLCVEYPSKFLWMASGPLQDPSMAALELERSMKEGAVGAIVAAHIEGKNLGECELDEYWAACVQFKAPVFIHPAQPVAAPRAKQFSLNQIVAYTNDTTLTLGSMMASGVLDRFPDLQLILSHGGGSVPWLIGRFDRMYEAAPATVTGIISTDPPSAYLRRFHYDTILQHGLALCYLRDLVGIERILLGTDAPFPPGDPDPLETLEGAGFSKAEIDSITSDNPKVLFNL